MSEDELEAVEMIERLLMAMTPSHIKSVSNYYGFDLTPPECHGVIYLSAGMACDVMEQLELLLLRNPVAIERTDTGVAEASFASLLEGLLHSIDGIPQPTRWINDTPLVEYWCASTDVDGEAVLGWHPAKVLPPNGVYSEHEAQTISYFVEMENHVPGSAAMYEFGPRAEDARACAERDERNRRMLTLLYLGYESPPPRDQEHHFSIFVCNVMPCVPISVNGHCGRGVQFLKNGRYVDVEEAQRGMYEDVDDPRANPHIGNAERFDRHASLARTIVQHWDAIVSNDDGDAAVGRTAFMQSVMVHAAGAEADTHAAAAERGELTSISPTDLASLFDEIAASASDEEFGCPLSFRRLRAHMDARARGARWVFAVEKWRFADKQDEAKKWDEFVSREALSAPVAVQMDVTLRRKCASDLSVLPDLGGGRDGQDPSFVQRRIDHAMASEVFRKIASYISEQGARLFALPPHDPFRFDSAAKRDLGGVECLRSYAMLLIERALVIASRMPQEAQESYRTAWFIFIALGQSTRRELGICPPLCDAEVNDVMVRLLWPRQGCQPRIYRFRSKCSAWNRGPEEGVLDMQSDDSVDGLAFVENGQARLLLLAHPPDDVCALHVYEWTFAATVWDQWPWPAWLVWDKREVSSSDADVLEAEETYNLIKEIQATAPTTGAEDVQRKRNETMMSEMIETSRRLKASAAIRRACRQAMGAEAEAGPGGGGGGGERASVM